MGCERKAACLSSLGRRVAAEESSADRQSCFDVAMRAMRRAAVTRARGLGWAAATRPRSMMWEEDLAVLAMMHGRQLQPWLRAAMLSGSPPYQSRPEGQGKDL